MTARFVLSTLTFWMFAATEAVASARGAPEIDGPAGIAACALLISVGLLAYNRFRK